MLLNKKDWLLKRLLVPAGVLPKLVEIEDLWTNAWVQKKLGNAGFEFMLLVDLDPNKINNCAIGHKILSVHAPLPNFSHGALGKNKAFIEFMTNWIYGPARFPNDPYKISEKTMEFAYRVGAKTAVFHTYHLGKDPQKMLQLLHKLSDEYKVTPAIEHEGPYIYEWDGYCHDPWTVNPFDLIKFLDKTYPQKKFSICYDTCSQIGNNLPVLDIKKVWERVAIVHLADSTPGKDLALEVKSPIDIELVNFLYEKKFDGLIHLEVNGAIGFAEEIVAKIYGVSSLLGIPIFKNIGIKNAQAHQLNSYKYLIDSL